MQNLRASRETELVNGGYPNALVSGGVVQELDTDRNVVFQWRTWDHYSPDEMSWPRADRPIVSQFHLNTINMDVDGNLYVTRHGKGTVVKLKPSGEILQEIDVLGKQPSNICFGGTDGRTAYVTEMEKGRLVSFRVDRPGLAWQRWQSK